MRPSHKLTTRAEYVSHLKKMLPPEAFVPVRSKLWQIAAHFIVLGIAFYAMRVCPYWIGRFLLAAIIGHALTCLVFLAHELSHGAIIKRSPMRYALEIVLWGLNVVPVTMWQKVHNQLHHVHANTLQDTDRFYLKREFEAPGGRMRSWYTRFFFPHRKTSRWNLGVGFHFITYIVRHLTAVFYPGESRPAVVTNKPKYTNAERLRICFEVLAIVAMQVGIYYAVGGNWSAWIWASPVALLFTSTFAMSYIWTNHYLHELDEFHDPVLGSTSVEVHPVFDKLHNNFSFHTEHHLFPSMSADYYPLVCQLLKENFADRYHRLRFSEAWQQLWRREAYLKDEPSGPELKAHFLKEKLTKTHVAEHESV